MKNKDEIIQDLKTVIKSCEEGRDGTWDCTTDEGKEGFDDMITLLDRVIDKIEKLL